MSCLLWSSSGVADCVYVDNMLASGFKWNLKDGKESKSLLSTFYFIFCLFLSFDILKFLFKFKFRKELST
jgi:hypothetical protein